MSKKSAGTKKNPESKMTKWKSNFEQKSAPVNNKPAKPKNSPTYMT